MALTPTHLIQGVQPCKLVALCCNVHRLAASMRTDGDLIAAQLVDDATILDDTLSTQEYHVDPAQTDRQQRAIQHEYVVVSPGVHTKAHSSTQRYGSIA